MLITCCIYHSTKQDELCRQSSSNKGYENGMSSLLSLLPTPVITTRNHSILSQPTTDIEAILIFLHKPGISYPVPPFPASCPSTSAAPRSIAARSGRQGGGPGSVRFIEKCIDADGVVQALKNDFPVPLQFAGLCWGWGCAFVASWRIVSVPPPVPYCLI